MKAILLLIISLLVQSAALAAESISVSETGPEIKHTHGALSRSGMTHVAIQEEKDGKVVEWMEKVSDEEYAKITK